MDHVVRRELEIDRRVDRDVQLIRGRRTRASELPPPRMPERAHATKPTAASESSGSHPNTTSQITTSAKTCIIAPSAASARVTVFAGSHVLVVVSPGRTAIVAMDIEIVE